MRSRRFRKRIEIWQTSGVKDGYGGNISSNDVLLTTTWADISSMSQNKPYSKDKTDFGITNSELAVIVTVRRRNDLTYNTINQFIKYAGQKYTITSFPENKNFDNTYLTFIAVKEDLKYVETIESIDVNAIYDNYENRVVINGGVITSENCQKEYINTLVST